MRGATFSVDAPQEQPQSIAYFATIYNTLSSQNNSFFNPQDCKQVVGRNQRSSVCQSLGYDGNIMTAELHHETAWQEFKEQTLLTSQDDKKQIGGQYVVRHKTQYTSDAQTEKVKELFDIVRYPQRHKITREFVVFQYGPDGKTIQRIYYSKYSQIADTAKAALIRHSVFTYDDAGAPLKGHPETCKAGKNLRSFLGGVDVFKGSEALDSNIGSNGSTS